MDRRPWQPILEHSAREAALEAARAIATALAAPSRAASTPSASLAGGDAGEALFFAYLAQAFPGEGHEDVAFERLERAIAALAEDSPGPSLCSGFAGVAWVTAPDGGRRPPRPLVVNAADSVCARPSASQLQVTSMRPRSSGSNG